MAVVDRRGRRRFVQRPARRLKGVDELVDAVAIGARRRLAVAFSDRRQRRVRVSVGSARRGLRRAEPVPPLRRRTASVTALWFQRGQLRMLVSDRRLSGGPNRVVELRRSRDGRWARRAVGLGRTEGGVLSARTARNGAQAVIFQRGSTVYAAMRRPGGRFRATRLADVDRFDAPVADIASSGHAVVAGVSYLPPRIRVATARPGHRFGRLRALRTRGVPDRVGAAVGRRGRIALAWADFGRRRRGARLLGVVGRARRPRVLTRDHGTLALASGAPAFLGRTPVAAYTAEGRVSVERVR